MAQKTPETAVLPQSPRVSEEEERHFWEVFTMVYTQKDAGGSGGARKKSGVVGPGSSGSPPALVPVARNLVRSPSRWLKGSGGRNIVGRGVRRVDI